MTTLTDTQIHRYTDTQIHTQTDRDLDIMTTAARRAAAVKKSYIPLKYLIYKSRALNFAFKKLEIDTIYKIFLRPLPGGPRSS